MITNLKRYVGSPDCSLVGNVALITGARGGIGRSLCAALSAAGARVVASGVSKPPDGLQADIWLQHDVTSSDAWSRVVSSIQNRYGRLDCLVNNAGICTVDRISNISLEGWRRVSSVNVESVLLGLQASMELLRSSGADRFGGSSVVNVSSAAGLRGFAFHTAYCASKGAVTLLTKAAAREYATLKYPIRVNSIHPGSVETKMMDVLFARYVEEGLATSIAAARAESNAAHPIGRMAQPDEIAAGVLFLCSAASSFMTGSELILDGGAMC